MSPGKVVEITYLEFDLEHSYQCYYNYLAVYDGDSDQGQQLFRDCSVRSDTRVVSSSNVVYIELSADQVHYGVKFKYVKFLLSSCKFSAKSQNNVGCNGEKYPMLQDWDQPHQVR